MYFVPPVISSAPNTHSVHLQALILGSTAQWPKVKRNSNPDGISARMSRISNTDPQQHFLQSSLQTQCLLYPGNHSKAFSSPPKSLLPQKTTPQALFPTLTSPPCIESSLLSPLTVNLLSPTRPPTTKHPHVDHQHHK